MHRSPTFRSLAGAICAVLISHVSTAWAHDPPEPDKASQGAMVGRPGADKQGRKAGDVPQKASGFQNPGVQKGFNPQPEPPGDKQGNKAGNAQSKASGFENPGAQRGFNPQPEPPGDKQGSKAGDVQSKASGFQNPGAQKGFNPQPEPPGKQLGQLPSAPANAKQ